MDTADNELNIVCFGSFLTREAFVIELISVLMHKCHTEFVEVSVWQIKDVF